MCMLCQHTAANGVFLEAVIEGCLRHVQPSVLATGQTNLGVVIQDILHAQLYIPADRYNRSIQNNARSQGALVAIVIKQAILKLEILIQHNIWMIYYTFGDGESEMNKTQFLPTGIHNSLHHLPRSIWSYGSSFFPGCHHTLSCFPLSTQGCNIAGTLPSHPLSAWLLRVGAHGPGQVSAPSLDPCSIFRLSWSLPSQVLIVRQAWSPVKADCVLINLHPQPGAWNVDGFSECLWDECMNN